MKETPAQLPELEYLNFKDIENRYEDMCSDYIQECKSESDYWAESDEVRAYNYALKQKHFVEDFSVLAREQAIAQRLKFIKTYNEEASQEALEKLIDELEAKK